MLLTATERLTMNTRPKNPANARNLNFCGIGSSGSGKTRFWLTPQLLQAHSSYVVVDPKGSVLGQVGTFLQNRGYKIKVFNSIDFSKSMHYNPLSYIRNEADILKFVNALISNTKGEGKEGDPFWQKSETLLYCALIAYIIFEGPEEDRNMNTLVDMISGMEVKEDDDEFSFVPLVTVLFVAKGADTMPKRRANGEGNIRKRKDGRWEGRYTVGHDPETGKAIIKNVLGKTQAEVKEKLKKAIEENVGIDYGRAKTYTVGSWLEVWMENYAKIKLRPSTFKTSQGFLKNHIKPQIGGIPLADLTSLDLQRFYKHLLDGGRVDRIEAKKKPKGLAPKTVRNIHQMIGSAYNLAMEQKLVTRNPTQGCALPKVEHKEMKTLTADQLSTFFREARDSGVYELYYLDLATGLRRGELLGLKWTDIDLDHGVLKIQRAISRQNGKVVEAPLKTKNAYRTLPLSADAISVLKMQKCKVGNSEWVFPSPTGGPMSPDSVLHMLQRVLKRAGLPRIRFHDLRHTFATMALQNGVDVKTVSSMLGHYSAGFTLDTYAHVTTDAQLKAAQTMGSILSRAV